MTDFYKKKISGGFTLVETLVALFIFSVSVVTVMSVLSQGIKSTDYSKDKVTAEYLAQEGIEYFRNMRDTYVLSGVTPSDGWNKFITKMKDPINMCGTGGCYFDNNEETFNTTKDLFIYPFSGQKMSYNSSTGRYGYTGTLSKFSRKMMIEQVGVNDFIKVISEVSWGSGTISFSEYLYNWVE